MNKKIRIAVFSAVIAGVLLTGCDTQASRVSENLSQQADNFN